MRHLLLGAALPLLTLGCTTKSEEAGGSKADESSGEETGESPDSSGGGGVGGVDSDPNFVRFTFVPAWRPHVEDIDLESYTHVSWFVLSSQEDGSLDLGSVNEAALNQLIERAAPLGVKVLISIGQGEKLQPVASQPGLRKKFVDEVVELVDDYGLDGVDLDWEPYDWANFPNSDDTLGYGELAQELCPQLRAKELLCTVDVYSSSVSGGLIPDELLEVVDLVNIMAYDYEGQWSARSGHHGSWSSTLAGIDYWETRVVLRATSSRSV